MEYSRLINDYLEGELHPVLEDKLFSELALNQDLRFELNKQIKIHLLTKSDMHNITIPSESTEAIFGNLGFSIPSASSNYGTSALMRFTQSFSNRKTYKYLTSIATAVLVAFMLYSNFDENKSNKAQNSSPSILHAQPVNIISDAKNNNYPNSFNRSNNNSAKASATAKSASIVDDNTSNYRTDNNSFNNVANNEHSALATNNAQSNEEIVNINEPVNQVRIIEPIHLSSSAGNLPYNSLLVSNTLFNQPLLPQSGFTQDAIGIEVSWSKQNFNIAQPKNLPQVDKTFAFGSNFSILYNINQYHSLGFEFGEETFPEEFLYFNGEQNTTIKQNPNYQWFAGSYRYMASNWQFLDMFTPYSKLIVGGARGGVLAKAQLGISWQLNSLISANISGEYGTFFYNVNKNLYHSDKFGIMYGLTMHL
jgi:hypothetical protein